MANLSSRMSQLREQSINAIPTLDPERALLLTQFYQNDQLFNKIS